MFRTAGCRLRWIGGVHAATDTAELCLVRLPLSPRRARIALQAAQRSVQELAVQLADAAAAVAAAEEAEVAAATADGSGKAE